MRILLLSDIHERLPNRIPDVDAIIFAGDFALRPRGKIESELLVWNRFILPWLSQIHKHNIYTIAIAGNHDFLPYRLQDSIKDYFSLYLESSSATVGDKTIFGFPWTLPFCDWAFPMEEENMKRTLDLCPRFDIVVSHGGCYGILDKTLEGDLTGSKSMLEYVERTKPELFVCGHIHESRGIYSNGDTLFVNASHVNRNYEPYNLPMFIYDTEKKGIVTDV